MIDLVERPLQLHCDNRAIKLYYNSDKSSAKSKHIDIKFLVIKDRVRNHIVFVNSILFLTLQIYSLKDCQLKFS